MSYLYTVGLKVIVEEVLTALTETPTVYAYDFLTGDALTSPAPTITSVRTGVYRLSVTANVLTDVLFVFIPHQDDEDKIGQEALMHEKIYHVVDELANGVTLVDGAITATKIASNAINDTKIATDAIDVTKISDGTIAASKIAIDAVAKIQSGLATSNALSTTDGKVDAVKAKTDNLPPSPAAVGSAMILTSAYDKAKDDVLTPLGVIDGKADAIKLQTDKIPNTPAVTGEYTSALTAIQADLNDPDQYKADVSALAKVTDLSGLAEKTDIPSDYAKANDLSGLAKTTDITALNNLSAAEMLNEVVVGTFTLREILTILAAKSDGYPATGGGTTTITYGGIDGTPGVIVETVDEDGNRSKVEFNL
jgi:hypothetical protein